MMGYRCFSLVLASSAVNCQSHLSARRFLQQPTVRAIFEAKEDPGFCCLKCTGGQWQTTLFLQYQANSHQLCFVHCRTNCFMPLPYVMPTAPLFYSITLKTEYEPKKVLLTVDVTALVTKEDSPGRSALLGLSLPLQHLSFCFDYFPIRP